MDDKETKTMVKSGVIAAIYFVLTIVFGEKSFGPIQFRISEAMTILPFYEPAAVPGLFVGCFIANIFGGLGPIDIFCGSLTTLLAAYLTSKMPNKYLATLPPILLNSFIIPIWVSKASNMPYIAVMSSICFSEFISVGVFGLILSVVFERVYKNKNH
ncbi:MAG TPA: hypothetical protein DEF85_06915 [Clostridiaceae bacterium]|jgi:uncharacterized membrane protein|nr:hypothetical protein [Clostridiaceae bacterium]HBF76820.1 hypothetical protein [Clostridiaceae bacterium]HBG38171.1 hypothetical protein [Clostridiaceae bacterium]HBN29538.1 hypothetical protein [Clostridiaceae bacterium]HBX48604.1 hypothetical protein [Clostridiaceae bacterium]